MLQETGASAVREGLSTSCGRIGVFLPYVERGSHMPGSREVEPWTWGSQEKEGQERREDPQQERCINSEAGGLSLMLLPGERLTYCGASAP